MVEINYQPPVAATRSSDRLGSKDPDQETAIGRHEIIAGLAGIAMDESAPVTARVSAYSLLGKHLGLFAGIGGEPHSDLASLMREIADRDHDIAEGSKRQQQAQDKARDAQ